MDVKHIGAAVQFADPLIKSLLVRQFLVLRTKLMVLPKPYAEGMSSNG